ncbi:unnamed protein product [Clonostachys rosea]|uniref:Uncharacterized protein n=1 Tax=Bionectria ochroleuca TaxID=29856 RepID=A0ABY6UYZ3_BIOOC|nr:unnamed protein product [Clonostachys rosea]
MAAPNVPEQQLPVSSRPIWALPKTLPSITGISTFISRSNTARDEVQRALLEMIKNIRTSDDARKHLKRLLSEYSLYKDRHLSETESVGAEMSSLNRLAAHWILTAQGPPTVPTEDGRGQMFSEGANGLINRLVQTAPNTLQLIVLSEQPDPGDLGSLISFRFKTKKSLQGRLNEIHLQPMWIIHCLISHYWNTQMPEFSGRVADFDPYSLRPVPTGNEASRLQDKIYWGVNPESAGNMDRTCAENKIFLYWQRDVTPYTSDMTVYVWEPHKSLPVPEFAKVDYFPATSNNGQPRLLIRFRSCHSTVVFSSLRKENYKPCNDEDWHPEMEVLTSILCVFSTIKEDTTRFVFACHKQIHLVHIMIRQSPSSSKMSYLNHIEDCISASHCGIVHAQEVLQALSEWSRTVQSQLSVHEKSESKVLILMVSLKRDFEYFKTQLEQIKERVEEDKKLLHSRSQSVQELRLFRLTILAGIFLPLSFTTSIFGMNMQSDVLEGLPGLSERAKCVILRGLVGGVTVSAEYWRALILMIVPFFIYLTVFGNQLSFAAWVLSITIFVLLQVGMFIRACIKQERRKFWAALIIVSAMSYAVSPPIGGVGIMYVPWAVILLALLVIGSSAILRQRRLMGRQPISEEMESGVHGLELRHL